MQLFLRIQESDLKAYWGWFLAWGLLATLLGLFAIGAAALTTLISVVIIGFILLLGGFLILIDTFAFWWRKGTGFFLHLFFSLVYFGAGLMLINNPAEASAVITMVMAIFFILIGASRITYALSLRVMRWQWTFLNGFISLLLGILVITNLPAASPFLIGLFVGIDLVFLGTAYIFTALAVKEISL